MKKLLFIPILVILSFLLFAGCTNNKHTDAVIQWSDPTVEQLVRDYLGKPDGDIRHSDLDFVKEITVIGGAYLLINNLPGEAYRSGKSEDDLEPLLASQAVMAQYNESGERTVSIGNDQYVCQPINSCADFADFANLTELSIKITEVYSWSELVEVQQLQTLSITCCDLSDLSVLAALSELPDLTALYLDSNEITDLQPLADFTNLTTLSLRQNMISDIGPLAGLTNLTYLDLFYNDITEIDVLETLTLLVYLDLDDNSPQNIDILADLTNLRQLNLDGEYMMEVSALAAALPACDITFDQFLNPIVTADNADTGEETAEASTSGDATPANPDATTSTSGSSSGNSSSSGGTLYGIWVESGGGATENGMYTVPMAFLLKDGKIYVSIGESGLTAEDMENNVGGVRGSSAPSGSFALSGEQINVTWADGSTAVWDWDGVNIVIDGEVYAPEASADGGRVVY